MKKLALLRIQAIFYILAGLYHFINPEFYYKLIPDYLPFLELINIVSGGVEIALGTGLFFKTTRKWSAYGIVLMLIAFIPSHIYFIQVGGCVEDGLCVPLIIGWIRLVLVHPLLIWWAWIFRND